MAKDAARWKCTKCGAYLDQFQTAADAARAEKLAGKKSMRGQIAISLALIALGLGITLGTAPWSSSGSSTWFISVGPIIVGVGQLFRIYIHYYA